ncbi:hypothetical protein [Paracoccus halophilus]|uniref:hypothetical protein n=1 Tax=Paracoccus halophilus TaxID=376733 RepID=UPI000AF657CD|nr:hypothetical protein [Paracoccus halophilus]
MRRELAAQPTTRGYHTLPLIHRGMVPAHVNALDGIVPNGWEGQLWNLAGWSRAE